MVERYKFLAFHINFCKLNRLWPLEGENENSIVWKVTKYTFFFISFPNLFSLYYDLFLVDSDADIYVTFQSLLASFYNLGFLYMSFLFLMKRKIIRQLIDDIVKFEKFTGNSQITEKVDRWVTNFTKAFMFYALFAVSFYFIYPLLTREKCESNKDLYMIKHDIPCGLLSRARFPFKINYSPLYEVVEFHQVLIMNIISLVIICITMFLCGLLLVATENLKYLSNVVENVSSHPKNNIEKAVRECVIYHQEIIEYTENINKAFGSTMLLHITLTGLVMSVLGFEIITIENLSESVKMVLHLIGWLILLYIACFYSQNLMNESMGVGISAYNTAWYNCSIEIQRDLALIITRSQRPLVLNANNFGVMSRGTFLNVLTSAYSYFTLLMNMRK